VLQVAAPLNGPKEAPDFGFTQKLGQFAFAFGFGEAEFPSGLLAHVEKIIVVEPILAGDSDQLGDGVRFRISFADTKWTGLVVSMGIVISSFGVLCFAFRHFCEIGRPSFPGRVFGAAVLAHFGSLCRSFRSRARARSFIASYSGWIYLIRFGFSRGFPRDFGLVRFSALSPYSQEQNAAVRDCAAQAGVPNYAWSDPLRYTGPPCCERGAGKTLIVLVPV
jgi:hypothetical protein